MVGAVSTITVYITFNSNKTHSLISIPHSYARTVEISGTHVKQSETLELVIIVSMYLI